MLKKIKICIQLKGGKYNGVKLFDRP